MVEIVQFPTKGDQHEEKRGNVQICLEKVMENDILGLMIIGYDSAGNMVRAVANLTLSEQVYYAEKLKQRALED